MIRAALTIDSDTRSGDNQRIIAGTPFHPIKIIEAKNTTFFKITIVKLTSSVPKKLIANANKITTRMSSNTAAPSIVVLSRVFIFPKSRSVCTEILTLVAHRSNPKIQHFLVPFP